jgi:hypothetical protein
MLANTNIYTVMADVLLAVHAAFVVFVVSGFVIIWIGYFCGWPFVYDFRFRLAHLLAIGFVLIESLVGMVCPLTSWESQLRLQAGQRQDYDGSFMQHWVGRTLFYDLSEENFTMLYAGFFCFVVLTFWVVKPRWPLRTSKREST